MSNGLGVFEVLATSVREAGVVSTVMVVGGTILLARLPFAGDSEKAIMYVWVGSALVLVSIAYSFVRLWVQKDREKLLMKMVENSCNRLAEQIAKDNMNDHKVDFVTQKIRKILKDTTNVVYSVNLMDGNQRKPVE